ncbi:MAG: serine/threonine protein kinase, partial [Verrucomicrobiae bacterium]|nr:serine/threonine protein kinase [Verrucomicrobiae bacterium]
MAKTSDIPDIPEFKILGRIGGGSYGEVFLARSVTGNFRAVKVVRREDFERERTFEREFEGIQHYEKVSQDHPGLVDVLHAGRNDKEGYYYYVMELADDVETGSDIDIDHYTPRTLASDLKHHRLRSVRECVEVGSLMADALGHLHAAGLTHRDVKPSNVIFVKGVAKLADVGLVASSGQRTFVGTEGYVPPEGPGTALADLYSLAMVLYEMGTGKDRLEFPELPTNMELPPTVNRDEWRALNAVICRAGAPDPRRRFENGAALSAALRRIVEPESGSKPSWHRGLAVAVGVVTAAILGAAGFSAFRDLKDPPTSPPVMPPNAGNDSPSSQAPSNGPKGGTIENPPPPFGPEPSPLLSSLPNAFDLVPQDDSTFGTVGGGSVGSGGKGGKGVVITDPSNSSKAMPPKEP